MKRIIQFKITKDEDGYYVAEGIDIPVVTQGKSLDELAHNIREATDLCLEDEDPNDFGVVASPSVLINFELPQKVYAKTEGFEWKRSS